MYELNRIYDVLMEKLSDGAEITMNEIEESFCEAALSCGRVALSEMPEDAPICLKYGEKMRNIGQREKRKNKLRIYLSDWRTLAFL